MRIVDLLSKDSILLNASPKNKAEAIDLLVDLRSRAERSPTGKLTSKAS
jgi:fructose PTS system EIIBC or EIIC component